MSGLLKSRTPDRSDPFCTDRKRSGGNCTQLAEKKSSRLCVADVSVIVMDVNDTVRKLRL